MKKLLVELFLILNIFASGGLFAQDDIPRLVVVNMKVEKTGPDADSTAGDLALITLYDNGKEIETYEATVDDTGHARFEYPASDGHYVLWPRVRHQNMMFSGHTVHAVNSPAPIDVLVNVYDVLADSSRISAGSHQIILKEADAGIHVTEFVQLKNTTNFALTSAEKDRNDRPIVVSLSLPQGHKEFTPLKYFAADALGFTDDGFYDTMAIPPGTYDTMFTYLLPVTSNQMVITRKITIPTDDVMVFSQLQSAKVTGLGEPAGQLNMQDGSPADYYMIGNKKPGDQVVITIAGLEAKSSKTLIIVIAAAFLLLAPLVIVRLKPAKK